MMLHPLKLNLVWLIIDQTKSSINLELSDSEIIQHILEEIEEQILLSTSEVSVTYHYVKSRMPLIRDLAEIHCLTKDRFNNI